MIRLLLILALSGCAAQPRVQDQAFRDFLIFRDICQNERGLKQEVCQELWVSFMDAQAKLPAPQTIQTSYYSETNYKTSDSRMDQLDETIRILNQK